MSLSTAQSVAAGIKKTFQSSATTAGLRLAGVAADPSTVIAGDTWYRTDLGRISFRDGTVIRRLATDTSVATAIAGRTAFYVFAASDTSTEITTGTAKESLRIPFAMTLTAVWADVVTAPTGSSIQIDLNESGASILSTPISIDAGETYSQDAAVLPVISDPNLAAGSVITPDFDQVGLTFGGAGVKIYLLGVFA